MGYYEYVKNDFKRFLKEEGVYNLYLYNMKKNFFDEPEYKYPKLNPNSFIPTTCLTDTFGHFDEEGSIELWENINKRWIERLKNIRVKTINILTNEN